MSEDLFVLAKSNDFANWMSINDTIMGGSSQAICSSSSEGLSLKGFIIEEKGGFVSCRSNIFSPPIDLSRFTGIQLDVEGEGRTLKFAISCKRSGLNLVTDVFWGGLRWVTQFETRTSGRSCIRIPFDDLVPTIRAKPFPLPLVFNSDSVEQLQLLHSKFGTTGNLNSGFMAGSFHIILHSISAYV